MTDDTTNDSSQAPGAPPSPCGGPKRPEYEPKSDSERLGYLVEECGEVLAATGKTLRWGLDSTNPELPSDEDRETNREWLRRELLDLQAAIDRVAPVVGLNQGTHADQLAAHAVLPEGAEWRGNDIMDRHHDLLWLDSKGSTRRGWRDAHHTASVVADSQLSQCIAALLWRSRQGSGS